MRLLISPLVFGWMLGCSTAQEPATDAKLKIGDKAPAIVAEKWLNGPAHKGFEPGKAYIVDFWAIWCGPCIEFMPHLADMQAQYKEQGLVVLPLTTIDNRNPMKAVDAFVKDQAMKLPFSFGILTDDKVDDAYRLATGIKSLPASFVVDKQGKLAFVGHPLDLDDVVPKVLAGTWKGKDDSDAVIAGREAMLNFMGKAAERPLEALKDLPAFEAKYPTWAARDLFVSNKILILVQGQRYDEAKKLCEEFMAKMIAKKNIEELQKLRTTWTDPQVNPDKKNPEMALKIAEAVLKLSGDNDPLALIGMAEAYYMAGKKDKAIEYGEKSVKVADDPDIKKALQDRIALYKKLP